VSAIGANWDLLRLLVVREVRVRYARAALGMAWAIFLPVVMLMIFSAVDLDQLIGGKSDYDATPYALFAFTGLIFWMNFQQSLITGTSSLAVAHDILHKSRFPAELIPVARVLAWLLDLGIGFVLLLAMMLWIDDVEFHATALLVPVVFLLQFMFTVGLALLMSSINLFFRDVHYMLTALMPLCMLASNVAYPIAGIEGIQGDILRMNPIVSYLDAYRRLLFLGEIPTLERALPGLIGAFGCLAVGVLYFRRVRHRFAEEV
jgi:homopolymeric O-antigen transport system permease protein